MHFQPLFPTSLFVQDPFNARYWPIVFLNFFNSNSLFVKYLSFTVGLLIEVWINFYNVFPVSLVAAILILYLAKLKLWLDLTKHNMHIWGSSKILLQNYRTIELVNQIGFSCLSTTILPTVYSAAHISTACAFASLVKGFSVMALEVKINHFIAIYAIITCMNAIIKGAGEIVEVSKQAKQALWTNMPEKHLRKQILARRDIRIYFNSAFFMENGTFMVFLDSVINNTISIVLTGRRLM